MPGSRANLWKNLITAFLRLAICVIAVVLALGALLVAYLPSPPPVDPGLVPVTLPTYDARDVDTLCADLNAPWGKAGVRGVDDLEKMRLQERHSNGDNQPLKLT